MIDLNLKGLIRTTHAALPHLLSAAEESERGCADVVTRPWHVCLSEILIRPTEQVV